MIQYTISCALCANKIREGYAQTIGKIPTDRAGYIVDDLDVCPTCMTAIREFMMLRRTIANRPDDGKAAAYSTALDFGQQGGHVAIRTSLKGEPFIGRCIACGEDGLTWKDVNRKCERAQARNKP